MDEIHRIDRLRATVNVLLRVIVNAAALWVAAWLLPGISLEATATVSPEYQTLATVCAFLFVGLVFGVVNTLLRKILHVLALPITCLTLGFFALVVNAGLLELTAWLANFFPVDFRVENFFWNAILGSIIVSLVSAILGKIMVREER